MFYNVVLACVLSAKPLTLNNNLFLASPVFSSPCFVRFKGKTTAQLLIVNQVKQTTYLILYALPFGSAFLFAKLPFIVWAIFARIFLFIYTLWYYHYLCRGKICACIVAKSLLGIVCTAKPIQHSFNFTKFAKKLNNILDKGQI
ncbi:MAG: hypothetical protein IKA29_01595 [Clostridia bacterium]|nr:hypothetical protein [Clostridia bacterium]